MARVRDPASGRAAVYAFVLKYVPPAIELGPPGAKKPAHYRQLPAAHGGPAATARSWRVWRVGPRSPAWRSRSVLAWWSSQHRAWTLDNEVSPLLATGLTWSYSRPKRLPQSAALSSCESRHRAQVQGSSQLCREVTSEVLDGVDRNPVVQDSLQEGVFAQFVGELYRYRPSADDLAYLAGVGMATPPGEQVTDDDQVRPRRTSRAFAARHRSERIGGVGLEAFALAAALLDGPSSALCCQFEAVDERHTRSRVGEHL